MLLLFWLSNKKVMPKDAAKTRCIFVAASEKNADDTTQIVEVKIKTSVMKLESSKLCHPIDKTGLN